MFYIIGVGCRFPGGADSATSFWHLMCEGIDTISEIPAARWNIDKFYDANPAKPGKMYIREGGFLRENIFMFDPLFFGISPREAQSLDPQQRLLLEITWEAFEDAGIVPGDLAGSDTGVYIGGFTVDNSIVMQSPYSRHLVTNHTHLCIGHTILSNRLSYAFDFRGPSITVDTACSSSLVAAHLACRGLLYGECGIAVVGGANIMLIPEASNMMCKGLFLSPFARCMAFDDRASGYARGEGAGVVILKPLSAALTDNNRVYAVIRATGVNQDGHTPSGIPFPNRLSQEQLLRRVCGEAGVSPGDIAYVEAHGTGTQAGDQTEAAALNAVLSEGRHPDDKCAVGSVKTNIGHTEAAAGVAGLIKTALCLKHKTIPPNLHFNNPNPLIPFDKMCIRIPTEKEAMRGAPLYAGVNSFGYGGTNSHVLLQEAPVIENENYKLQITNYKLSETKEDERKYRFPLLIPVSARDENALKALAKKYYDFLSSDIRGRDTSFEDFCYSASFHRTHHHHRLALIAGSRESLCESLKAFSEDEIRADIFSGSSTPGKKPRLVFIYTGMGPQWQRMGQERMTISFIPLFLMPRFSQWPP